MIIIVYKWVVSYIIICSYVAVSFPSVVRVQCGIENSDIYDEIPLYLTTSHRSDFAYLSASGKSGGTRPSTSGRL